MAVTASVRVAVVHVPTTAELPSGSEVPSLGGGDGGSHGVVVNRMEAQPRLLHYVGNFSERIRMDVRSIVTQLRQESNRIEKR
jgi:hypothetical protein